LLAGRAPKTMFARHYLGKDMKDFSKDVLGIEEELESILSS